MKFSLNLTSPFMEDERRPGKTRPGNCPTLKKWAVYAAQVVIFIAWFIFNLVFFIAMIASGLIYRMLNLKTKQDSIPNRIFEWARYFAYPLWSELICPVNLPVFWLR